MILVPPLKLIPSRFPHRPTLLWPWLTLRDADQLQHSVGGNGIDSCAISLSPLLGCSTCTTSTRTRRGCIRSAACRDLLLGQLPSVLLMDENPHAKKHACGEWLGPQAQGHVCYHHSRPLASVHRAPVFARRQSSSIQGLPFMNGQGKYNGHPVLCLDLLCI
jgi:hypothetical protein